MYSQTYKGKLACKRKSLHYYIQKADLRNYVLHDILIIRSLYLYSYHSFISET
jgi:hypothetical protein